MNHVNMMSGGVASWASGKRVAQRHGTLSLRLPFADVKKEDEDLYRFLPEAAANIGVPVTVLSEGRDPWQVFFDVRFLGNTRLDPCSRVLKRELLRTWLEKNFESADTTVYLGYDGHEEHRLDAAEEYWFPWKVEAPLCWHPRLAKADVFDWAEKEGLKRPRLYDMGFTHNNCGGACVKAGQAQWALLLERFPERFAYEEAKEEELRKHLGKDIAILRDRRGGPTKPMTLKTFRERIEARQGYDASDLGGCSCFTPPDVGKQMSLDFE